MSDALEYYRILQVSSNADVDTIKQAYRDLAKRWHPDYNSTTEATDVFQKISVAYEVLENKQSRLIYDIMSLVYDKDTYPDIAAITPIQDNDEGTDIRVVKLQEVISWIINYKIINVTKVVNFNNAIKLNSKISLINWFLGWWHPKGFIKNIKAIKNNFKSPLAQKDSLKVLLHNMIAFAQNGQVIFAIKCGMQARTMVKSEEVKYIDQFLNEFSVNYKPNKNWNIHTFRIAQCIVPILLVLAAIISFLGENIKDSKIWQHFSSNQEIDYYQRVDFGSRGQSVDDVIVGKIMSIPIDKTDNAMLYHLVSEAKVMYGPSDDFDVIKTLPAKTTVRLTGKTPDNVWARIMIDNGENGFVRTTFLNQGIGNEIPFGSSIIE